MFQNGCLSEAAASFAKPRSFLDIPLEQDCALRTRRSCDALFRQIEIKKMETVEIRLHNRDFAALHMFDQKNLRFYRICRRTKSTLSCCFCCCTCFCCCCCGGGCRCCCRCCRRCRCWSFWLGPEYSTISNVCVLKLRIITRREYFENTQIRTLSDF